MPTVLVVEDERDIREVLRRYLERAGLSVLTTGTGAEAIRLLTSALPDLGCSTSASQTSTAPRFSARSMPPDAPRFSY